MCKPATRFSLSLLLATSTLTGLSQTPATAPNGARPASIHGGPVLRPVPRTQPSSLAPAVRHNPQHEGWDLRWRRSRQAPAVPPNPSPNVPTSRAASSHAAPLSSAGAPHANLQVAPREPDLKPVASSDVSQATWLTPAADPFASPDELRAGSQRPQPSMPDYFEDPFGDDPLPDESNANSSQRPGRSEPNSSSSQLSSTDALRDNTQEPVLEEEFELPPPRNPTIAPVLPNETRPMNELRGSTGNAGQSSLFDELNLSEADDRSEQLDQFERLGAPDPQPEASLFAPSTPPAQTPALAPAPQQPLQSLPQPGNEQEVEPSGPSLGDMLRVQAPNDGQRPLDDTDESLPPPTPPRAEDQADDMQFDNPFQQRDDDADTADKNRLNSDSAEESGSASGRYDDQTARKAAGFSCDDFRKRIAEQTIDQVSLDISPPYRPDEFDMARYERLKADFDEKQSIRVWRSRDGRQLAVGRLRNLAYENAVIETEYGSEEDLPINRLSEADIAYITENWDSPRNVSSSKWHTRHGNGLT